jgi:subtilisin family serine protease
MTTFRRRTSVVALTLVTGAAGTCALGVPSAAADGGPDVRVVAVDTVAADADPLGVAAVLLGEDGRPTFVDVEGATLEQAARRAAALPGSDGVAYDTPVTAMAVADPLRPMQWSLDALGVERLPGIERSGSQLVAVVDSGVRATHEDFGPGQVRCDLGIDLTSERLSTNGCVDPQGHGTHVAGVVGAVSGNGRGIAGVAPGTAILPVRVLDRSGSGGSLTVARGIVFAADRGAQVINLSLGGPAPSSALNSAISYARSKGAVVVVAAGNNRGTGNEVTYPAASPGALSVASLERTGLSSSFSYSGPSVDLAAPGGSIVSLWGDADNTYVRASGTSMAAPAVSAVVALYRAANPSVAPAEVEAALLRTARDVEAPGKDDNTGFGMVDPTALWAASAAVTPAPAAPAPAPVAVAPAPAAPAPVVAAPVAPVPVVAAPTSPAPSRTAPVVTRPAPPTVRVVNPRVRLRQRLSLALRGFRPGSTVTVSERYVPARTASARTPVATTVVLARARVATDGSRNLAVLPVQSARTGTLVLRGTDRAGRVVTSSTAIRVG